MVRAIAFLTTVLALAGPCSAMAASVFYVDQANIACSDTGPGTENQPYCTIGAAVAAHSGPGTTILVKPGVYREQVTVPTSGSAGNPFIFRAIGGTVVVDGSDDWSGPKHWEPVVGDVYLADDVTWSPKQVYVNGLRLTPTLAPPDSMPVNSFHYELGVGLYLNIGDEPDEHEILVGRRLHGFRLSNRSFVTVEGFEVARTEDRGIYLSGLANDCMIRGNHVRLAFRYGIATLGCTRDTIEANVVTDNQDDGIALISSTACVVQDNESARNVYPTERRAHGIGLSASTFNLLQRNRLHHNQDTGEHLAAGSSDNTSIQNLSYLNEDHGYDRLNSANTLSIGDVAYGNFRDGFSNEGTSPGGRIFDCIAIDNGLTTNRFDLWVDPQSSVGFVSDYNIFWNSTSHAPIKYQATIYPTIAAYRAVSGQDTASLQIDPRFVDAASGNFHLQPDSPAIDAATSAPAGWPANDAEGIARVDDPSTPNSGAGPVPFADRGALEYHIDHAPVVTAPATASVQAGTTLVVPVTASDPDGDPIASLTVSGLPAAALFAPAPDNTSGTLTWTPLHADVGSYPATFTATNALIGSAVTTIQVLPQNQLPVAALTLTPPLGEAPLVVTADASGSTDPDGTVVSYRFDFGDGTVVGPQPSSGASHAYAVGNWTATVTVTDDAGGSSSTSGDVVVMAPAPNLVANPSFETNTDGWSSHLGGMLTRVPGGSHGDWALEVTGPAVRTIFGINDLPNCVVNVPDQGTRYRFTVHVRAPDTAGAVCFRVRERLGTIQVGFYESRGVTLSSNWTVVTTDYVTKAAGSYLDVQILDIAAVAAEVFLLDDISIRDVTASYSVTLPPGGSTAPPSRERPGSIAITGALGAGEPEWERVPMRPRVYPDPVRSQAMLAFRTSQAGSLRVELYDIRGRRVRQVLEETAAPAGVWRLPIGDHDDHGAPLGAGVYFYLVQAGEGLARGRFVITH